MIKRKGIRCGTFNRIAAFVMKILDPTAVATTAVSDTQINLTWQNPEVS